MKSWLTLIFVPRTKRQLAGCYVFWHCAFQGVFVTTLRLSGLGTTATTWYLIGVGAIVVTPFLTVSLLMLHHQIGLQRRLKRLSRTDQLTGLPNRRAFFEEVGPVMQRRPGALLMIDVDQFKQINDRFGHGFGDLCLQNIAEALRPVMPHGYALARLGGEEFAIMIFGMPLEQARQIGLRVSRGITMDNPETGEPLKVTNSVGLTLTWPGEDLSSVMRRADHALYDAKANGRARVEIYQTDLTDTAADPAQDWPDTTREAS